MRSPVPKISVVLLAVLAGVVIAAASAPIGQMLASGSIDEAIRTLSSQNDAASLNFLSRAYYAIEQFDNAVKNGEKAVSLAPDNALYHQWLSLIHI